MKVKELFTGEPSLRKTLLRGAAVWLLMMSANIIPGIARSAQRLS